MTVSIRRGVRGWPFKAARLSLPMGLSPPGPGIQPSPQLSASGKLWGRGDHPGGSKFTNGRRRP